MGKGGEGGGGFLAGAQVTLLAGAVSFMDPS